MASYIYGTQEFTTKAAALDYFKAVLRAYTTGSRLAPEHAAEVLDLFWGHPRAQQKAGPGVSHIEVRRGSSLGGSCFWVIRVDGTTEDFSYKACIQPATPLVKLSRALRLDIQDQLKRAREGQFGDDALLYEGGRVMTRHGRYGCDVDHVGKTFAQIRDEWLKVRGLQVGDISLTGCVGGGHTLADPDLRKDWQDFHEAEARLVCVPPEINQGIDSDYVPEWLEARAERRT